MSTIHASAVLIGRKAVLIRGPSGAGKSMLAWDLIQAAKSDRHSAVLPFARLVADDRALVEAKGDPGGARLLVRPAPALAGLIEIRGLGIRRVPCEAAAVIGLIVDLAAQDAARMPDIKAMTTTVSGVPLPRLAVAPGGPALSFVLAWLGTATGPGLGGD